MLRLRCGRACLCSCRDAVICGVLRVRVATANLWSLSAVSTFRRAPDKPRTSARMWQAAEQPVPKLNLARATSALYPTTAAPSAKAAARPMSAAEARPKSASRTEARPKSASRTSASAPNAHGATSLGPRAALLAQQARTVMEGRMNKLKGRGPGVSKAWVPQHFVLKADALYYTPNQAFSHKMKKVSLGRTKIGTAQHYTRKDHAFGVLDSRSGELHVMCAETDAAMHEWIKALIAVRSAIDPERALLAAGLQYTHAHPPTPTHHAPHTRSPTDTHTHRSTPRTQTPTHKQKHKHTHTRTRRLGRSHDFEAICMHA